MFLKSLEIYGFKSFADRTHINFADGITALLGPNGCGKSNVVDAIKWVLAENNPKNVRASAKEDVIFDGTETRSPLSMAEVTLTIANENGLLQMEDTEIAIKRRLYRSGEGEYFINGRAVGPTAIKKLFMDTGVGKSAYSVMEQGKIDQILSSKPEDRRYLFEEAAGISRSKSEVAEAERELEHTRANLAQIDIGLSETKRNYETLKVQADKAAKYRRLQDEIFDYDRDINLLRLKKSTQEKAKFEADRAEAEKRRSAAQKEIEEIYETLNENTDRIKNLQEQVNAKQQEQIKIFTEQSGKKALAKQLHEQQNSIREKIGQIENRIKNIKERIDEYNEDIDNQNAELYEKNKKQEDISRNINGFIENIRQSESQVDENQKQIATDYGKIHNLETERANMQKQLAAITEDIVTELDARLKDAGYSSSANKKAKDELYTKLEQIKIFANGRANIFRDAASLPSHTARDADSYSRDALQAFTDLGSMLEELKGAVESYARTTPQFIDDFLAPEGIITQKRSIDGAIEENLGRVGIIQKEIDSLTRTNSELSRRIDEYKETLSKLRVNQAEMIQQIHAAEQQIGTLRKSLAGEEAALREQQDELGMESRRRESMDEQIEECEEQIAELQQRGDSLTKELNELDRQIADCNSRVSGKQSALQKKQDDFKRCQMQLEKLNLSIVQKDTEIQNTKQNFQESRGRDLMEFEERMYTISASPTELKDKLAVSKQKMQDLGNVNLMAMEQFAEEKDRYERQLASYNDTQKTLENLVRVSEEIRTKSSEMFLTTYNRIRKNFHNMFRRLMGGGGRAELRLADPANVLTSGIEIYAQPPGKKLESISLLSGGEKTMTAIALLFATYQVRPSPFCLLDEIDAALDDKNVASFVSALGAFSGVSQYIIITHNRKTVVCASTLLGVTMQESGVTKVVQIRKDEDTLNARLSYGEEENFVEEDVPPEEGIVIPPRPPRREHNPDGSLRVPGPEQDEISGGQPGEQTAGDNGQTEQNPDDGPAGQDEM